MQSRCDYWCNAETSFCQVGRRRFRTVFFLLLVCVDVQLLWTWMKTVSARCRGSSRRLLNMIGSSVQSCA